MWRLARTPRWIGALVFAFAVAAIFGLLGQWQLSRAIESGQVVERATETIVPLESVAEPQQPVTADAAAQRVSVSGVLVPGSFTVLTGRSNSGVEGAWVMGQLVVGQAADAAAPSLAVALGWAPDAQAAASVVETLPSSDVAEPITGRYLPTEPPSEDDFENGEHKSASVAALVNLWPDAPASVYGGYLVVDDAPEGLDAIDSPPPTTEVTLNWLNLFYAIEWVVFAGLAFFLWYRLVKDAYERELEEAEERAAHLN
jgi:cytochrome oxidase assembly protein ShyY1